MTKDSPLVKIGVIGIGGAGCNAVNIMFDERNKGKSSESSVFNDVSIIVANTDVQDLENAKADVKIQLGAESTKGWGAGADPETGKIAAEESKVEILSAIENIDMLFITAGMGGGTGTGASPVISKIAKEAGILTVGVVTEPFLFEGGKKRKLAKEGIEELKKNVDTLVIVPNQKLIEISSETDDAKDMFEKSNEVLREAVKNISSIISNKAYINVDFADIQSIMRGMGTAMIGFGSATGENAAINAVKEALNNPLLSDVSINGTSRVLLNIGGMKIPMKQFSEAGSFVSEQLKDDATFIWGASLDESEDRVFALIVAEATKSNIQNPKTNSKQTTITEKEQMSLFNVSNSDNKKSERINNVKKMVKEEIQKPEQDEDLKIAAQKEDSFLETEITLIDDDEFDIDMPEIIDLNDQNIPAFLRQKAKKEQTKNTKVQVAEKSDKIKDFGNF